MTVMPDIGACVRDGRFGLFARELERLVVVEHYPRFVGMLAFWKLWSVWSAFRLDDHTGAAPDPHLLGERGISAKLVRSNTIGPGKKLVERAVLLSADAWVH